MMLLRIVEMILMEVIARRKCYSDMEPTDDGDVHFISLQYITCPYFE